MRIDSGSNFILIVGGVLLAALAAIYFPIYEGGGPGHKKKASAARPAITPRVVLGEPLIDRAARGVCRGAPLR